MTLLTRSAFAALLVCGTAVASSAHTAIYKASLTGPSSATGIAFVTLDLDLITMRVETNFSGLTGTVTGASIHAPTAVPFTGTAGIASQEPSFSGFPTGFSSGVYDHTFDLTVAESYSPSFIAASGGTVSDALRALDYRMDEGRAYFSIRTTAFPTGEIRGFLVNTAAAPEPCTIGLVATVGIGGLALVRRRR